MPAQGLVAGLGVALEQPDGGFRVARPRVQPLQATLQGVRRVLGEAGGDEPVRRPPRAVPRAEVGEAGQRRARWRRLREAWRPRALPVPPRRWPRAPPAAAWCRPWRRALRTSGRGAGGSCGDPRAGERDAPLELAAQALEVQGGDARATRRRQRAARVAAEDARVGAPRSRAAALWLRAGARCGSARGGRAKSLASSSSPVSSAARRPARAPCRIGERGKQRRIAAGDEAVRLAANRTRRAPGPNPGGIHEAASATVRDHAVRAARSTSGRSGCGRQGREQALEGGAARGVVDRHRACALPRSRPRCPPKAGARAAPACGRMRTRGCRRRSWRGARGERGGDAR